METIGVAGNGRRISDQQQPSHGASSGHYSPRDRLQVDGVPHGGHVIVHTELLEPPCGGTRSSSCTEENIDVARIVREARSGTIAA